MQTCPKCKITIRGDKVRCPLCEGALKGEAETSAFPVIPSKKVSRLSFLRMSLFLFVLFEAVMIVLCFILKEIPTGILVAMLAACIGIADVALTLYYRNNLLRMVTWEIYLAMILTFMINISIGRPMWSLIWVVPLLFAALMITTTAIGKGTKMLTSEFILYLLFDVVMSTGIQLLFILTKWNSFPLPSVISIAFGIVFFLGMVIFNHRAFQGEARKFFNV